MLHAHGGTVVIPIHPCTHGIPMNPSFDRLQRGTLLAAAIIGFAAAATPVHALEEPGYEVVRNVGDVELRQYAPYHIVSTPAGTDFEAAGNAGFRTLFRYISGANVPGEDIAMTAPVIQAREAEQWSLAFVVPAGYAADAIPEPAAPGVRIERVPGGLYAATRFSGRWSEAHFTERESALLERIAAEGLEVCGPTRFARYDPPFKPPFMRRNEILIPVNCAAADPLPVPAGSAAHNPAAAAGSPDR
jgi:hypothetical protein